MKEVLVVTEDLKLFDRLASEGALEKRIKRVLSLNEVVSLASELSPSFVLIDIDSIHQQELDYISYVHHQLPKLPLIILTSLSSLDEATRAIQSGALYYLIKPLSTALIAQSLEQFNQSRERANDEIESEKKMLYDLTCGSPAMEKTMKLVLKVAPTSATVFIGGENGTGKEFFAQMIHRKSTQTGKFVPFNCGAVPENLFESEIFGHLKGSFTGADKDKKGIAQEADGGTLFLDEVGELTPQNQVKLLRFLQERKFKPVGSNQEYSVNIRIISATNRDLREMVKKGTFREDLFYRLHVFSITLPPLRDRKETIPYLIRLFIHRNSEQLNKYFKGFTPGAEFILSRHSYPGNIRELENIIEYATIMAEGPIISEDDLPEYLKREPLYKLIENKESFDSLPIAPQNLETPNPKQLLLESRPEIETDDTIEPLEDVIKSHINRAMKKLNNNHSEVARALGISRSTLWRKLKEDE